MCVLWDGLGGDCLYTVAGAGWVDWGGGCIVIVSGGAVCGSGGGRKVSCDTVESEGGGAM